jgi:YbgC/YbaW family acyl-CoA thioester hydrolase
LSSPDLPSSSGTAFSAGSAPISELTLRRRVQFSDVDSAGIVHFSVYFRYMEEAEHAMWRAAGLSIAPRGSELGYPRVATSADYLRPLRFEDEVDVTIRVAAITRSTMRYACTVRRGDEVAAELALTIVCVRKAADGTFASTPLPPEVSARFAVAPEPSL